MPDDDDEQLPTYCSRCGGTGRVTIHHLDGTPIKVTCPTCLGTGMG